MTGFMRQKVVKTREPHICFGCGVKHEAGILMLVVVSVDMGKIFSTYWCDVCDAYWGEYDLGEEDIDLGSLRLEDPAGWHAVENRLRQKGEQSLMLGQEVKL